jgi:hypothetical protein
MKWTEDPPTAGGYYWVRRESWADPKIVWVYKDKLVGMGVQMLGTSAFFKVGKGFDDFVVGRQGDWWYGPVAAPEYPNPKGVAVTDKGAAK